eukprot:7054843-Ditylum_brightwellii.AAC.1
MTWQRFALVLLEAENILQLTLTYSLFQQKFPTTTEQLLENTYPAAKADLMSDIVSAWRAINNGTTLVTTKTQKKYWQHWKQYARTWNKDPFLDDASELEQGIILTAFAARVWT